MLDLSLPKARGIVPMAPLSSTSKPSSSGLKFLPTTERVFLSTETSALIISGARGVAVGVPVREGVGEGVTGVEVLVTVGVGGLKGK